MEYPEYRLKENCATILKTMLFAATFSIVIPYGSILVAIGLSIFYNTTKVIYF